MGGRVPGMPPLDPPMYVPKYHQKLGCQANGGVRAGRAPPRSANVNHPNAWFSMPRQLDQNCFLFPDKLVWWHEHAWLTFKRNY